MFKQVIETPRKSIRGMEVPYQSYAQALKDHYDLVFMQTGDKDLALSAMNDLMQSLLRTNIVPKFDHESNK